MKIKEPWKGSRVETHRLNMPCQFLMLCSLMDVEPVDILYDFMATVACESYGLGPVPQETALNYFIQAGYGQDFYTVEDIRRIFAELNAISTLWPKGARPEMITEHSKWRHLYYEYWFKKWYKKIRRKKVKS